MARPVEIRWYMPYQLAAHSDSFVLEKAVRVTTGRVIVQDRDYWAVEDEFDHVTVIPRGAIIDFRDVSEVDRPVDDSGLDPASSELPSAGRDVRQA